MDRPTLVQQLRAYTTRFPEEGGFAPRFIVLLQASASFERTHLPGHITGSAWILNPPKTHVLLVHHAKLNKWLQPGGHADGDENVLRVALREAEEETGVKKFSLTHQHFFDLDIHTIPARKDFPEHWHYDIRFLMQAEDSELLSISEESHDVQWIPLSRLEEFNNEPSLLRMKQKSL